MNTNEWEKLAGDAPIIQNAKNIVLNPTLFKIIENISNENKDSVIFDYGCGWGEWVAELSTCGFKNLEAYDEADEMVDQAISKFGTIGTFHHRDSFKANINKFEKKFDIVTSNLVLCILEKEKQDEMLGNIKSIMKDNGTILLSLCHPCFDYDPESIVSTRVSPKDSIYSNEFIYKKTIKENQIHFHDLHRPLAYFSELFKSHNLKIQEIHESSVLNTGFKPDFIIFSLTLKV